MIKRPWGGYTILKKTPRYWVKKLFVHPKARLSLQSHEYREEVWLILSGTIIAQIGNKRRTGKPGDLFIVPKKRKHRIIGVTKASILEVAFGKTLEQDIVRYEDDYGRI
jgi:mannose-6-phosphate isomerase-like protein (cupin superfamily)